MKRTDQSVSALSKLLLTFFLMGVIVSCMSDDGQQRIDNILSHSSIPDASRSSGFVPVFKAQLVPTSGQSGEAGTRSFFVSNVDFYVHREVRVDLGEFGRFSLSRYEVFLVDTLNRHHALPGKGDRQRSTYAVRVIEGGLLGLELLEGPGEHYQGILIRMSAPASTIQSSPKRQPKSIGAGPASVPFD